MILSWQTNFFLPVDVIQGVTTSGVTSYSLVDSIDSWFGSCFIYSVSLVSLVNANDKLCVTGWFLCKFDKLEYAEMLSWLRATTSLNLALCSPHPDDGGGDDIVDTVPKLRGPSSFEFIFSFREEAVNIYIYMHILYIIYI